MTRGFAAMFSECRDLLEKQLEVCTHEIDDDVLYRNLHRILERILHS